MNMKDTAILLIFLLSITGLIIGIYYTDDIYSENSPNAQWEKIYEENDSILTVTLEKKETDTLNNYLT